MVSSSLVEIDFSKEEPTKKTCLFAEPKVWENLQIEVHTTKQVAREYHLSMEILALLNVLSESLFLLGSDRYSFSR